MFFNFIPVGRGRGIRDVDLSPIEEERFMRHVYREMQRRKIEIYTTAPEYGRVVIQMSGGREVALTHFVARGDPITTAIAEFIGGCGAERIYAALQPDGSISSCVFMPINVGGLRYKSFREIWGENRLLKDLKKERLA